MTTYSLNKPSYFLFKDSASEVSYACESIIIINQLIIGTPMFFAKL